MTIRNWTKVAVAMANGFDVDQRLERKCGTHVYDDDVTVYFNNSPNAKRDNQMDRMRDKLAEYGSGTLGYGWSDDRYSYVMLVDSNDEDLVLDTWRDIELSDCAIAMYLATWNSKWLTTNAKSIDEMIEIYEEELKCFKEMRDAGVQVIDESSKEEDFVYLFTSDKVVSDQFFSTLEEVT